MSRFLETRPQIITANIVFVLCFLVMVYHLLLAIRAGQVEHWQFINVAMVIFYIIAALCYLYCFVKLPKLESKVVE